MEVGSHFVSTMSINSYDYEADFAPVGNTVIQTNFAQNEIDYNFWETIYKKKEQYKEKKNTIAEQAMERLIAEYPNLKGKIRVIDVWTPITYNRYCNSFQGSYMSFITTKNAKSITTPGIIKGIDNVFLASQWLMGPGGLPVAAAMGKFAAWRIIKNA